MSIIRELARLGNKIDSASTGEFLSKGSNTGSFDAISYTSITGKPTILDSALSSQLIDSSYVQLRQTVSGGGLDSALTIQLIDSSYVSARAAAASSGYQMYEYTATQGQTTFQDSDLSGNVLSYTSGGTLVFYNGVLMGPDDVTSTTGNTVVLAAGADSGSHVSIAKWAVPTPPGPNWFGDRAVNGGGQAQEATYSTVIEYGAIATGNSFSDFGDLTVGKIDLDACSSPTRALFWGGYGGGTRQEIDYITIATTGNASDFGDMSHASYWGGACSSGTRGCHYGTGAWDGSANVQSIDYVTIATTGNAADFGDIGSSPGIGYALKAVSSGTRGLWGGGYSQSPSDAQSKAIYYITFDTLGNGTSFGNLTQGSYRVCGAASDATYGLWGGGDTGPANDGAGTFAQQDGIEYITMSTPGNSVDFGDLTATKRYINATNNATKAVFMGGGTNSTALVDIVTIQTPGNATAWGDLSQTYKKNFGSASGDAS